MLALDVGPRVARRTPEGFDRRPYDRFSVSAISPTIGAEIGGIQLGDAIDDELQAELRRALLEWKVLVFRDQDLTREQQRSFAERWGDLEQHPFFKLVKQAEDQGASDVVRLSKGPTSPGLENEWHHDVTWNDRPSFGAVLRAVELPEVGGDTLWADAGAAFDGLPPEVRDRIVGLDAEHDWKHTFGAVMDPDARDALAEQFPARIHPVVRVHPETGRHTLFVNRVFTQRILGLELDESDALLEQLCAQFTRPEYQCRVRWAPGTVVFWDNRATVHYASSDYHPQPRIMDRISIAGDRPVGVCRRADDPSS